MSGNLEAGQAYLGNHRNTYRNDRNSYRNTFKNLRKSIKTKVLRFSDVAKGVSRVPCAWGPVAPHFGTSENIKTLVFICFLVFSYFGDTFDSFLYFIILKI